MTIGKGIATGCLFAVILLAGSCSGPAAAQATEIEVTYLANEGFLIAAGEGKVLIDALFPGIAGYPRLSGQLKADLEAARPPFDGVDLVLATHHHRDHFGPREVARFLAASGATFVSTQQALERLQEAAGEMPPEAEIAALGASPGGSTRLSAAGISVRTLDLHHGRDRDPPVQNLGFLIDIEGFKILHIGDTEITEEEARPLRLSEEQIDLALLPVWFLTEARWRPVVDRQIRPARVVAMHLAEPGAPASWFGSAGSFEKRVEAIESDYPEAWIPIAPLERRTYRAPAMSGALAAD